MPAVVPEWLRRSYAARVVQRGYRDTLRCFGYHRGTLVIGLVGPPATLGVLWLGWGWDRMVEEFPAIVAGAFVALVLFGGALILNTALAPARLDRRAGRRLARLRARIGELETEREQLRERLRTTPAAPLVGSTQNLIIVAPDQMTGQLLADLGVTRDSRPTEARSDSALGSPQTAPLPTPPELPAPPPPQEPGAEDSQLA